MIGQLAWFVTKGFKNSLKWEVCTIIAIEGRMVSVAYGSDKGTRIRCLKREKLFFLADKPEGTPENFAESNPDLIVDFYEGDVVNYGW